MSDATLNSVTQDPDDFAVQIADQIKSFIVADSARLHLFANLSDAPQAGVMPPRGTVIFATDPPPASVLPWSVVWSLEAADG